MAHWCADCLDSGIPHRPAPTPPGKELHGHLLLNCLFCSPPGSQIAPHPTVARTGFAPARLSQPSAFESHEPVSR